jgi:hypothetical protein
MRLSRFGGAVVLGLLALFVPASWTQAQSTLAAAGTGGVDPFSLYYGYYIPHAAAVAAQPSPLDTINAMTANRQQNAMTDRASLYDPISPYGDDQELLDPFSKRGRERIAKFQGFTSNIRGTGPATHYGRAANYFPGLRPGRGPNRNISTARYARFGNLGVGPGATTTMPSFSGNMGMGMGGGMGGMGGMGMGMPSLPGPR